MDLRGLERDIRKIPGVVACAIAGEHVSVLVSDDADPTIVEREASVVAGAYGAGAVRILGSPIGSAPVKARISPNRTRIAVGTAVAAALALIATLVPIGRKVSPRVAPPAAIRPAPASESGGILPPVMVDAPAAAKAPVRAPRRTISAAGPVTPVRPRVAPPGTAAPDEPGAPAPTPPSAESCDAGGVANGRTNHESEGNQSHHRHHTHDSGHDRPHWFDCT